MKAARLSLLFAAAGALLPAQTLQAVRPVISEFEDGPPLPASQKTVPGENLFFRFAVEGFKVSAESKVRLTGHVEALDPAGVPIAPKDENVIGTSLRDEDKDWKPRIHSQFQVPSIAPAGVYRVRFGVTDEQTHASAAGETTFTVGGIDIAPAPALAIRRVGFYRTQDEEAPLKMPAYRAGDMVWMRFDVLGYKYGEQNAIDVSYDVAVTNATDKQMFSQENAAVEKSQAFYPQPWVPGSFSLTLQSNTSPGIYTVSITAHDAIGNQTATEKARFRVE